MILNLAADALFIAELDKVVDHRLEEAGTGDAARRIADHQADVVTMLLLEQPGGEIGFIVHLPGHFHDPGTELVADPAGPVERGGNRRHRNLRLNRDILEFDALFLHHRFICLIVC